jgi:type II secretory pathway component PulK
MSAARTGFVLPVVLVIISLLALTMAGFIFFVRAETAGTMAYSEGQQARLAAESGLETVIALLRLERHNARAWFDAPALFRNTLVWSGAYDRESDPVRKTGTRTTLSDEYGTPPLGWRFGVTPEASKLNLNSAGEDQLQALLTPLLLELQVENAQELIAALLDWRDTDDEVREGGAESEYYNTLTPPYQAKNGPCDSVEELLLVKGFSAAILYGEDTNRNGLLDPNEDDGETSFPYYDNEDGVLNRGIAPFLTIWSREPDTALDNKPRINLNQDAAVIAALAAKAFTEDELPVVQSALDFIAQLKAQNFNFGQLGSPADLYQGDGLTEESGAAPGPLAGSPITIEQMPYIMNRFSTRALDQAQQGIPGLININTAPARVLAVIPGLTPETAALLVETRTQLAPNVMETTAWPLVAGVVDAATFRAIAPYITTKAYQFHVEVLGYGDHTQTMQRYEWVVEMLGQLAQVRYGRDLTGLGRAWPIDDDEIAGQGIETTVTGP